MEKSIVSPSDIGHLPQRYISVVRAHLDEDDGTTPLYWSTILRAHTIQEADAANRCKKERERIERARQVAAYRALP